MLFKKGRDCVGLKHETGHVNFGYAFNAAVVGAK